MSGGDNRRRRIGLRNGIALGCGFLFSRESGALHLHFDALDIFLPIDFFLGLAFLLLSERPWSGGGCGLRDPATCFFNGLLAHFFASVGFLKDFFGGSDRWRARFAPGAFENFASAAFHVGSQRCTVRRGDQRPPGREGGRRGIATGGNFERDARPGGRWWRDGWSFSEHVQCAANLFLRGRLSLRRCANRKAHRGPKDGTSHESIVTTAQLHKQQCFGRFGAFP